VFFFAGEIYGKQDKGIAFQTAPPKLNLGDPLPANLFVELAKAVNPSVVSISTAQRRPQRPQQFGPTPRGQDPFWEFFEQFMGPQYQVPEQQARPQALGSGFVIEADGIRAYTFTFG